MRVKPLKESDIQKAVVGWLRKQDTSHTNKHMHAHTTYYIHTKRPHTLFTNTQNHRTIHILHKYTHQHILALLTPLYGLSHNING